MSNSNFKNNQYPEKNNGNDSKLSRRDALKRVAKMALLFVALPAFSSIKRSEPGQSEKPESNYFSYYNKGSGYYSYYCEDYYGYIYNIPGSPYQSYQGYWELIYSSYCIGYYSYSKSDSIQYNSYSKPDSIQYNSYSKPDNIQYSSYYGNK